MNLCKVIGFSLLMAAPVAAETAETEDPSLTAFARELITDACSRQDAQQFFEAITQSAVIRAEYSAPQINIVAYVGSEAAVEQAAPPVDYPLTMVDYEYLADYDADTGNGTPVKIEVNQSQSNQIRVDWTRVVTDGVPTDGDARGTPIGDIGIPGYLLFEPTDTCWQLVEIGTTAPAN